jgi:hypothetical protein
MVEVLESVWVETSIPPTRERVFHELAIAFDDQFVKDGGQLLAVT